MCIKKQKAKLEKVELSFMGKVKLFWLVKKVIDIMNVILH